MKKYLFIIFIVYSVNSFSEEGYSGHFKGNENMELMCGRNIDRITNHWEVTITSMGPDSFIGKVDPRYGLITYKGTIDEEGKAKGRIRGLDTGGIRRTGFFNAIVDGDELTMDVNGMISSGSCHFRSRINATRFNSSK